ncbi:hypothetical protein WJX81_002496 [Elliptochloris bilobata]|uniref:Plastid lipid-associated protein/fibrillin conserved domain-containing protein n=1 Tax=Elliptochloris bilobata TaxID=381761 RepID=A0AAW1QY56_9CHLO
MVGATKGRQRQRISPARTELMSLVAEGSRDLARARQLVDALIAERVPFDESLLGGGPWQVVFSSGPLLWQAWTALGDSLTPRRIGRRTNKASQDFDPAQRSVVNRGEVLGAYVFVTASGTYRPLDASATTPVEIKASIESGCLHLGRRQVGLPIKGSGRVSIAYLDADLRVFRSSSGSTTVQMREAELARLLGGSP